MLDENIPPLEVDESIGKKVLINPIKVDAATLRRERTKEWAPILLRFTNELNKILCATDNILNHENTHIAQMLLTKMKIDDHNHARQLHRFIEMVKNRSHSVSIFYLFISRVNHKLHK